MDPCTRPLDAAEESKWCCRKSSELQVGRKVERDVGSQPASLGLRFRTEPVRSTKHFCDVDTKDSSRGAGCLLTSVCD